MSDLLLSSLSTDWPSLLASQYLTPKETLTGLASVRFLPLDQSTTAEEWETNLLMPPLQKGLCVGAGGCERLNIIANTGEEADEYSSL